MRKILFRAWIKPKSMMLNEAFIDHWHVSDADRFNFKREDCEVMQYTGIKDKTGKEIYEGDLLQFTDRWEWFRGQYSTDLLFARSKEEKEEILTRLNNEPLETRIIEMPECYEWLLSSEIKTYWEVIGNIWEHPNLKPNIAVPATV